MARQTPPGQPAERSVRGSAYLHDGAAKVALPRAAKPQITWTLGRLPSGGWLVASQDRDEKKPSGRYGVLTLDGHFDLIGEGAPLGAALSPDRSQLVYAVGNEQPPMVTVVDLATRRPSAELPAPAGKDFGRVDGWNLDGIWLRSAQGITRWIPGSPPQQAGDVAIHITAPRTHLLQQRVGDCDRLVSSEGNLTPQIEYCGFSPIAGVLSPTPPPSSPPTNERGASTSAAQSNWTSSPASPSATSPGKTRTTYWSLPRAPRSQ